MFSCQDSVFTAIHFFGFSLMIQRQIILVGFQTKFIFLASLLDLDSFCSISCNAQLIKYAFKGGKQLLSTIGRLNLYPPFSQLPLGLWRTLSPQGLGISSLSGTPHLFLQSGRNVSMLHDGAGRLKQPSSLPQDTQLSSSHGASITQVALMYPVQNSPICFLSFCLFPGSVLGLSSS